jgi:hypothetical protein
MELSAQPRRRRQSRPVMNHSKTRLGSRKATGWREAGSTQAIEKCRFVCPFVASELLGIGFRFSVLLKTKGRVGFEW